MIVVLVGASAVLGAAGGFMLAMAGGFVYSVTQKSTKRLKSLTG